MANSIAGRHRRLCDRLLALGLLLQVGGCAAPNASRMRVYLPVQSTSASIGFGRVLIAGFVTVGIKDIDLNEETARSLRTGLRSRAALTVIESEPIRLVSPPDRSVPIPQVGPASPQGVGGPPGQPLDAVFNDVTFWKRLGEEYMEPLIVTGNVTFTSVASTLEERTVGRRTVRFFRPGYALRLRVVLISGKTGELIESVPLRRLVAHATSAQERALSLYLQLMERIMPSVLDAVGHQQSRARTLLR